GDAVQVERMLDAAAERAVGECRGDRGGREQGGDEDRQSAERGVQAQVLAGARIIAAADRFRRAGYTPRPFFARPAPCPRPPPKSASSASAAPRPWSIPNASSPSCASRV